MKNKEKTDTMRVLILADVCNPEWPSLPVVGYKFARAISNYVNATVVTQIRNKPNIDRAGMGNAKVVYIDTENIAAPIQKLADLLTGGSEKSWTIGQRWVISAISPLSGKYGSATSKSCKAGISMSFTGLPRCRPRSQVLWQLGVLFLFC